MALNPDDAKFDELKSLLRRQLGGVSVTSLSNDQAGDAVSSAIREYSKNRPIEVIDFLTTTVNVAGYSLSDKERIMKVKQVFYSSMSEYWPEDFSPDLSMLGRLEGLSIFDNPSLWTQYMQRIEQFGRIFDGDFNFDRSTKLLTLIPSPTGIQKVYFIWTKRHVASSVPEDDIDTVMLWAKAEAKEMMANKMRIDAGDVRSVSGYGESVSFGGASETLAKDSVSLKKQFNDKFGGPAVSVG